METGSNFVKALAEHQTPNSERSSIPCRPSAGIILLMPDIFWFEATNIQRFLMAQRILSHSFMLLIKPVFIKKKFLNFEIDKKIDSHAWNFYTIFV